MRSPLAATSPPARRGGASCSGYIADVPDITLTYKAGMLFDLYVFVRASTDTTLVIRTPSGRWLCDDDSAGGEDPLITITDPASGTYAIWVGAYSKGGYRDAIVHISELGPI